MYEFHIAIEHNLTLIHRRKGRIEIDRQYKRNNFRTMKMDNRKRCNTRCCLMDDVVTRRQFHFYDKPTKFNSIEFTHWHPISRSRNR